MTTIIFLFIAGLITLIVGADLLIYGASRLAAKFGVSPLVIGLTIVAIGTASPEIAVSIQSAASGQGDLTLGNVLGSNIFNILFILGMTAMLTPIAIAEQLIRKDAPIMVVISLLTLALAFNGTLGLFDGILLLIGLAAYIVFAMRQSKQESKAIQEEYAGEFSEKEPRTTHSTIMNITFIAAGLGLLVLGSNWLVESAVQLARTFGVSELVIGLTVVAAGTSLPEVATSVIAALKKENDIAVGNVVGSNIFNLLCVLGLASVAAPGGINVSQDVLRFDIPVMIFVALVTLPIFFIDGRITRLEGGLLFSYYIMYMVYVVLRATQSPALSFVTTLMLTFAAITFMVLIAGVIKSARKMKSVK